jgi:hypothetical protein
LWYWCRGYAVDHHWYARVLLTLVFVSLAAQVKEDPGLGVYIAGCSEVYVTSIEECFDVMRQGDDNRAVAATGMNEGSSRSHSLFIIFLSQKDSKTGIIKTGRFFLVDLAGAVLLLPHRVGGDVVRVRVLVFVLVLVLVLMRVLVLVLSSRSTHARARGRGGRIAVMCRCHTVRSCNAGCNPMGVCCDGLVSQALRR